MKFNNITKFAVVLSILIGTMSMSYGAIATDAKLQYNKGIDYYQLGQLEESIDCFKKAVELDPNYIDAYYNLGSLLEYMRQDEAALGVFKQIILRKPDDYESVLKAARLSKKLGEFEKAKMYLSLIPKDTMIGQEATQLANAIDAEQISSKADETPTYEEPEQKTEPITQQFQQQQAQTYTQASPDNNTTKIFTDITSPTGIATDTEGNLFVAGFSDNTIYKIGPDNKKIVYIKDNKIDGPIGLAVDSERNIYVANYNKNNVLKISNTGEITELIVDIQNPYCIYITENLLFVSSQGSNSVIRYRLDQ